MHRDAHYPEPLVIPPLSKEHKQTFIILHGRGSNALTFSEALLAHPIHIPDSDSTELQSEPQTTTTLRDVFPNAKFIFPTASFRRSTIYGRKRITQWFDSWHITEPTRREELQIPGLRESVWFLHGLIYGAIQELKESSEGRRGARDVFVGGMSQGCATVLTAMLLYKESSVEASMMEEVGAWFGMCGWLPFRQRIEEVVNSTENARDQAAIVIDDVTADEEPVVFHNLQCPKQSKPASNPSDRPFEAVAQWLHDELELGELDKRFSNTSLSDVPIFLAHGTQDLKVPVALGREASFSFSKFGLSTVWNEYEGLGHWYSSDMLRDLVFFLKHCIEKRDRPHNE